MEAGFKSKSKSNSKLIGAIALSALLPVGSFAAIGAAAVRDTNTGWVDKRPVLTPASIEFGVYDPFGDFSVDEGIGIEHVFVPWEDADLASLAGADEYARVRGRSLLLTVEPWSWLNPLTSEELLATVATPRFDTLVTSICVAINDLASPVTIRWAHEMESTNGRFPWAGWKPEDYRAAYRQFVQTCREHAPNVDFMWSPKGLDGLAAYYPGDDVVDKIGLSVFGLQDYDMDYFGRDQTFAEVLRPKYDLVQDFGKPIYVAELGYEGEIDYVERWAASFAVRDTSFPQLQGVIYYNHAEIYPWPEPYGLPNWRVTGAESE